MKDMLKRTLALICVPALLLCCMAGITLGVTAAPTEAYSDWPLFFSAEGQSYNFESGKQVAFTIADAGVTLPDTATKSNTALYIHLEADAAAVAAMAKSQTELCNNICDQAELNWGNVAYKEGENKLVLPLVNAAQTVGSEGVPFDITAVINYFRVYTDNKLTANSTVTLYEIGLLDTTAAGLTFGKTDTYLQLSSALTQTPNTLEASIKMEPQGEVGNWMVVPMDGTSDVKFLDGCVPTYKTVAEDIENGPSAGETYASVMVGQGANGNGTGLFKFQKEFELSIPRSYEEAGELSLAFWLYTPTGSMPVGYLELTSSGTWDEQEICWKAQSLSLTAGWNYVVLPLDSNTNTSGNPFVFRNANYIRWYTNENAALTEDTEICIGNIKIIDTPVETPNLYGPWTIEATKADGFSGGTSGVSDGTDGLPAGTAYVKKDKTVTGLMTVDPTPDDNVDDIKKAWNSDEFVISRTGFTIVADEKVSKNDLVLSFWLYIDDVDNIRDTNRDGTANAYLGFGQIEVSSSGTYDNQEMCFDMRSLVKDGAVTLRDGWNYVMMPFTLATEYVGTKEGSSGNFNPQSINFLRWHSIRAKEGTNTFGITDMTISTIADYSLPFWQVSTFTGNDKVNTGWNADYADYTYNRVWTNDGTDAAQPVNGMPYMEAVENGTYNANNKWQAGFIDQLDGSHSTMTGTTLEIPETYTAADLAFSMWLYVSDASLYTGGLRFQVGSGWTHDQHEIHYDDYLLNSKNAGTLKNGWNKILIPLSDFPGASGCSVCTENTAFDVNNINFISFRDLTFNPSAGGNAVVRFADMKIVALEDKTPTPAPGPEDTTVDASALNYMIFSNTNSTDENPVALLVTKDNKLAVIWGDKQFTAEGDYDLRTGEWVDLAVVRDMTQNKFLFYVDGVLVDDADATGTTDIVPTVAHSIGSDGAGINGGLFEGAIADVRVWSDARTAAEIEAARVAKEGNSSNGLTVETEGLINSWFMVGDIQHVLKTLPDTMGQNPLVYRGSRADDWLDYDKTQYNFLYNGEGEEDYYSLVFIPDIQNIITGAYGHILDAMGDWIENNLENENIVHIIGAGDSTWNAGANNASEWAQSRRLFDRFTNKVSWSNLIGNHDYPGSCGPVGGVTITSRDSTAYNANYGLAAIQNSAAKDTYVGSFDDPYDVSGTENAYYRFAVNGVRWMILQLEYHPRAHVLAWADSIAKQYPEDNIILTTHGYIDGDANDEATWCTEWMSYIDSDDTVGGYMGSTTEGVWTNVVKGNSNIKMVLCGHADTSDGSILYNERLNDAGEPVVEMMINGQFLDSADGTKPGYYTDRRVGMLSILRFSADGTKAAVQYYAPIDDKSYSPASNAITLSLDLEACTHQNEATINAKAPTCTEPGYTGDVICADCKIPYPGAAAGEPIEATNHQNKGLINVKPEDCGNPGYTGDMYCPDCKTTLQPGTSIPATGNHQNTEVRDYDPGSCTTPGYTGDTWCLDCQTKIGTGSVIPEHETEVRGAKAATCHSAGYTGDTWCLTCGEEIAKGEAIPATEAHVWDEGKETTPASPAGDGVWTYTCTNKDCTATKTEPIPFTGLLGDVSGDGDVSSTDARMVLQFYVGKISEESLDVSVADVDGNGEVTSTDARLILQYFVGKITEWPVNTK